MSVPWDIRRSVHTRAVLEIPCHRCGGAARHGLCQRVTLVELRGEPVVELRAGESVECHGCALVSAVPRRYFEQLLRRAHAATTRPWSTAVPGPRVPAAWTPEGTTTGR